MQAFQDQEISSLIKIYILTIIYFQISSYNEILILTNVPQKSY